MPDRAITEAAAVDAASEPVLAVIDVSVRYGEFCALTDVTIRIMAASIHAVIGPNGAGKSTLAGVVSGEVKLASGRVLLGGVDTTKMPTWKRSRLGVGRGYQVARVFDSLTVQQNLEVASRARADRIEAALDLTGLGPLAGTRAQALSAGDRKRLEIAMISTQGAPVMVLDEPTAGMSAAETDLMGALIASLRDQGVGILVIEHDLDLVFRVADVVTVLSMGKTIFSGSPRETLQSPIVRDVYLHDRSEYVPIIPAAGPGPLQVTTEGGD